MKLSWRDTAATLLAMCGATIVYAKLESYSWWLIGSWKRALAVLAGIGVIIAGLYFIDWLDNVSLSSLSEMMLWLTAATVVVGSLFAETTKTEFLVSAIILAVAWLAQLGVHTRGSTHRHTSYMAHL